MNILTDELPNTVEIDGVQYHINTDFRYSLRVIRAFENNRLTQQEKQIILLSNLYSEPLNNLNKAIEKANWFLNGGKGSGGGEGDTARLFSFDKDVNFIFSAFKQTHSIDLSTAELHWWVFMALFMDLGQDTTFCQLVGLRKRLASGKATKEEKLIAREMKEIIEVPDIDNRTLNEKEEEEEFMRLYRQGKTMKGG